MFLEFYRLREQPFGVTPDPRFLFLSPSHREALASLYYAIETKRGFSALVAEPGMGKTSLIFRLMDSLKSCTRTAFLFQSQCDSRAFLRSILNDTGILCSGQEDLSRMQEMLNEVLIEEARLGRRFVLVVDEAQNLDGDVLESVRLLSNFETPTAKLMHIVLAGQPALSDKLARPELVQLKQRVPSVIQLSPFSLQETAEYIDHRLRVAGYQGACLFTGEAVALINRFSDGIPRNINNLCFQALSLGFVNRATTIDAEILSDVLTDLGMEMPARRFPRTQWPIPTLPDLPHPDASEAFSTAYRRGSRVAFVGLILLLPILFLVFFRSQLLSERVPGKLTTEILAAVIGAASGSSHDVPGFSPKLRPPSPPPIAEVKDATPISEEVTKPNEVAARSNQEMVRPTERHKSRTRSVTKVERGPRVVWAQRQETIFQIALEYYGKSDWTIVRSIRAMNPEISDSYEVIREGQRIVLPDLLSEHFRNSDATSATSSRP